MTLFADPVAPRFADLTTPFRQDRRHNVLAPPYRTGGATYGYSMQDAVYCLGAFALEPTKR